MNPEKWIKDSFLVGLITGIVSLTLFYFIINGIRSLIISYLGNEYILRPPAVQLLTMLVNIIFFRILMVNFDKEKTGKGLLFITVILTLVYFYFYFRVNR